MAGPPRSSPIDELLWREAMWSDLKTHSDWPFLKPEDLRKLRLYGGAAGIWLDKSVTGTIHPAGVAVSVLHTGKHYDDEFDSDGIIYHYPTTNRSAGHDASEIEGVKQAGFLRIPIFVILRKGKLREVRRGWVMDHDDQNRLFLIEFGQERPVEIAVQVDQPFTAKVQRKLTPDLVVRAERNPRFKFEVVKRHSGVCAVSGLSVVEMLDGAHVVPVSSGGSDDPRNGLLLSASHHRAYDKHLWTINPKTLDIETTVKGPSLKMMKFEVSSVKHLLSNGALPHPDALEMRYELFEKSNS
jgi:putative restriction endonuclease